MKKPFKHTDLSDVICANPTCALINGRSGDVRRPIKKNVVERFPSGKPLVCYACAIFKKTGMMLKDYKEQRAKRRTTNKEMQERVMHAYMEN